MNPPNRTARLRDMVSSSVVFGAYPMTVEVTSKPSPAPGEMDAPSVFVNRFQVAVMGVGLVRLSFGEAYGIEEPVHFRGTIIAHQSDIESLVEALNKSLAFLKGSQAEPKPESTGAKAS